MIRKHAISFKHAFEGIAWALRTQPNYRIHGILALLSVTASFLLPVSYNEFLIIIALIAVGLAFETINTSIEKVCDAVDQNYNEHIKIAKDVAAGGMLFFAMGAFVIACIIFIPKILAMLG